VAENALQIVDIFVVIMNHLLQLRMIQERLLTPRWKHGEQYASCGGSKRKTRALELPDVLVQYLTQPSLGSEQHFVQFAASRLYIDPEC
jgi:hypothetical protein